MKFQVDHLALIQSNTEYAGCGAFSKTPIKHDEIVSHNIDIPVEENIEDRDYLVQTASGNIFSRFNEKQFNFGRCTPEICMHIRSLYTGNAYVLGSNR